MDRVERVFAGLVVLVLVAAGCDSGSSGEAQPGDPVAELQAAIDATLAASGFRTTSIPVDPETGEGLEDADDGKGHPASFTDYQLPDRVRDVSSDSESEADFEVIAIGFDTYQSTLGRPGFYTEVPYPEEYSLADDLLGLLETLSDTVDGVSVERSGDAYSFALPPRAFFESQTAVEATSDDGHLSSLELRGESFDEEATTALFFSHLGGGSVGTAHPQVDIPGDERVAEGRHAWRHGDDRRHVRSRGAE